MVKVSEMNKTAKKELFNTCKQDLKKSIGSTKYFDLKFFDDFLEYQRLKFKVDVDDKNSVNEFHKYLLDHIFSSDLYNKNSPCYCELLSVAWSREKEFKRLLGMAD